jgi:DNA polymerase-4
LARQLQSSIFDATGLSCSIGLAPNKLLAKIASDMQKPKGLSLLTPASIEEKLWPLPVSRLHGVGPRTAEKLQALGLHQIAQLARCQAGDLQAHFGAAHSRWLIDASWGIDERPLVLASEPLSMSRETTLERDMHPKLDRLELGALFTRLCQQLADDLQNKERLCRAVSVKIRNDQFKTSTRDLSFAQATDDPALLRHWAGQCLKRFTFERRIRLMGVKAARLISKHSAPASPAGPISAPHCEDSHSENQATSHPGRSQPFEPTQHPLWPELEPVLRPPDPWE